MKKVTVAVVRSIFLILSLCSQQLVHVSSSTPLLHGNQESAGGRNHKQGQEQAHEVHCSRERSRAARKVIEEYLTPFVERENYELSSKCRLHPENDMFRDQEEHKIYLNLNEWQCGYCKKSFRDEKFLDQHFDNRHYNLLNLEQKSLFQLASGALILVLLPVFYLFLYLVQRDMKSRTQELCRISKVGRKTKPS